MIKKQPVFALLLLFLYVACLTDIMDLTRPRLELTVFSTRNEHANHYIVHAIVLTILIIVLHVHAFEHKLNGQIKLLRIKGIF